MPTLENQENERETTINENSHRVKLGVLKFVHCTVYSEKERENREQKSGKNSNREKKIAIVREKERKSEQEIRRISKRGKYKNSDLKKRKVTHERKN